MCYLLAEIFFMRFCVAGEESLVPIRIIDVDPAEKAAYPGLVPVAVLEKRAARDVKFIDGKLITHDPTGVVNYIYPGALRENDDQFELHRLTPTRAHELEELVAA